VLTPDAYFLVDSTTFENPILTHRWKIKAVALPTKQPPFCAADFFEKLSSQRISRPSSCWKPYQKPFKHILAVGVCSLFFAQTLCAAYSSIASWSSRRLPSLRARFFGEDAAVAEQGSRCRFLCCRSFGPMVQAIVINKTRVQAWKFFDIGLMRKEHANLLTAEGSGHKKKRFGLYVEAMFQRLMTVNSIYSWYCAQD